jgi:hypothetical protein
VSRGQIEDFDVGNVEAPIMADLHACEFYRESYGIATVGSRGGRGRFPRSFALKILAALHPCIDKAAAYIAAAPYAFILILYFFLFIIFIDLGNAGVRLPSMKNLRIAMFKYIKPIIFKYPLDLPEFLNLKKPLNLGRPL